MAARSTSGWQSLVDDQAFTRATDESLIENTDANIDLSSVTASHIAIVVDSSFGGNFVGLAEMQFYGSPALGASAAVSGGVDGSSLSGLTLESQQLSVTDEALLLFKDIEEEESDGGLLSDPYTSSDLDSGAFQQLGLLDHEDAEEEEKEEDFGSLLVLAGLSFKYQLWSLLIPRFRDRESSPKLGFCAINEGVPEVLDSWLAYRVSY